MQQQRHGVSGLPAGGPIVVQNGCVAIVQRKLMLLGHIFRQRAGKINAGQRLGVPIAQQRMRTKRRLLGDLQGFHLGGAEDHGAGPHECKLCRSGAGIARFRLN